MRYLITLLLLVTSNLAVADHISDVREWPDNGLPIVSNWNTGGYTPVWHVKQLRDGNRFLPSFKLNPLDPQSPKSLGPKFSPEDEAFLKDNRVPLSLRSDNWATNITSLERLPISLESIPNSPVIWTIKGGVLGDGAVADCFGPASIWKDTGYKWATKSGIILDLQKRFPDASWIVLGDNNESNVDSLGRYISSSISDKTGITTNTWKSPLEPLSLRVRDYATTNTPEQFMVEFASRRDSQYNSLRDGFNEGLTAWRDRLYTEAYKIGTVQPFYGDQFGHYDGGGPPLYVSGNYNGTTADFTSADWFKIYYSSPINLKAESENQKHFREWFIQFFPGAAFEGYQSGRHEIMTQERVEAFAQWLLWSTRGNHRGINLRCFTETRFKPTDSFLDSDAAKKIVTDAGHPELIALTEEDYFRPLMSAANRIAESSVLRRFFQEGHAVQTGTNPINDIRLFTTYKATAFPPEGQPDDGFRLLECDVNTPRSQWVRQPGPNSRGGFGPIQIKVWGTATELNGTYLIHLWCPCKLPLDCNITLPNGYRFPVTVTDPNEYRLVEPLVGYRVKTVQ